MTNLTFRRAADPLNVSFEFFPPKTPEMEETLWASITRLAPMRPRFVSVTYGAGGSTRERTHRTVRRILTETGLVPAAHLTCVGATRAEVDAVADAYWWAGVRHVVALRGDPPAGGGRYEPRPDGYDRAASLVAGLRRLHDFEISVAAYPTGHPESPSLDADLDNLKRKIEAGATRAITQFFFDNTEFLRFRERASAAGFDVPLVPGIMLVTNFVQTARFAEKAGVRVPASLRMAFEGLDDDPVTRQLVAITVAAGQVRELAREGVTDFHFYTLNRAELVYALCHILGIRPRQAVAASEGKE
jgi:methylenetetrahydrofolate reductase (NADPH)